MRAIAPVTQSHCRLAAFRLILMSTAVFIIAARAVLLTQTRHARQDSLAVILHVSIYKYVFLLADLQVYWITT